MIAPQALGVEVAVTHFVRVQSSVTKMTEVGNVLNLSCVPMEIFVPRGLDHAEGVHPVSAGVLREGGRRFRN